MVFIREEIRVAVCRLFLFLISHLFLKAERQRMRCAIHWTWRSMRRGGVTGASGWRNIKEKYELKIKKAEHAATAVVIGKIN